MICNAILFRNVTRILFQCGEEFTCARDQDSELGYSCGCDDKPGYQSLSGTSRVPKQIICNRFGIKPSENINSITSCIGDCCVDFDITLINKIK